MINEFRDFILRGNLVELAVAVVIGSDIPLLASRPVFCTAEVGPAQAAG